MVIYLDQCAISSLARNGTGCPQTERLRQLLINGHQDGRLVCPIPHETVLETIGISSKKDRMAVYDLQSELADLGGVKVFFKTINKIINEASLAIASGLPVPTFFELGEWHRSAVENDQMTEQSRNKFVIAQSEMVNRFSRLNAAGDNRSLKLQEAKDGIMHEHASHVFRQIERLHKRLPLSRDDHLGYDLACFLRENQLSDVELTRLMEAVRSRKWEAIPVIWYRTQLAARREVTYRSAKPKKYDVNDEVDIPRMAVAMNSASVCITERSMAALMNDVYKAMLAASAKRVVDEWRPKEVFAIGEMRKAADYIETFLAE